MTEKIKAGVRAIAARAGIEPAPDTDQPSAPLLYGGPVHSAQRIPDEEYWHNDPVTSEWRRSIEAWRESAKRNGRSV
jgi:hypothetical protein